MNLASVFSMRMSRSVQLFHDSAYVHKVWRCANKEFLLSSEQTKKLYMDMTKYAYSHKSVEGNVQLHAYCIMDNHVHMLMSYDKSSNYLSRFMRVSHARFGAAYNRVNNRSGKVANERPKTPLIENGEFVMKVHFYIEANPLRANMVKFEKLKFYKFSTFKLFAYGIKDEWTELITFPDWYMQLGKTMKERQKKYIKCFKMYLAEMLQSNKWSCLRFIGSYKWQERIETEIKKIIHIKTILNESKITDNSS